MINQLGCTATQAGEIEEAERMRSMLEHESWQVAELLPQGWRWRQDPKVILRSYSREAQENNLPFEVFCFRYQMESATATNCMRFSLSPPHS